MKKVLGKPEPNEGNIAIAGDRAGVNIGAGAAR
jgi:hypothetical protein